MISYPKNKNFYIGPSKKIKGQLGVLSLKDFKKNQRLFEVKGKVRSLRTIHSLPITAKQHVEPFLKRKPTLAYFLNHSCKPNSFLTIEKDSKKNTAFIVALNNIRKGQEILADYSSFEYDTVSKHIRCRCGEKSCRGKITGFRQLSKQIKKQYIAQGIIPAYIFEIHKNSHEAR